MLYIGLIHLPQAVLSLRGNRPIGQGDPELAVLALLLNLIGYAHSRLLLLQHKSES
jgi:hypothetical protein